MIVGWRMTLQLRNGRVLFQHTVEHNGIVRGNVTTRHFLEHI